VKHCKTVWISGLSALAVTGCLGLDVPPLDLKLQDRTLVMNGVIDSDAPALMRAALDANPNIDTLVLQNVPGSIDDERNLEMAALVRARGLTTIVPANGMVASGGTDLFLAGVRRVAEPGACLGVHSWAAGGLFGYTAGRDVPRDDPQHQIYLEYYDQMGIDRAFYWFTLEQASVEEIYWMSPDEVNRFEMTSTPQAGLDAQQTELLRYRCDDRLFVSEG